MDADTLTIEAVITQEEYRHLVEDAATSGLSPNDFLRHALNDAHFLQRNAPPGSKILIESGGNVRTVGSRPR
jgi:hypothetical protein